MTGAADFVQHLRADHHLVLSIARGKFAPIRGNVLRCALVANPLQEFLGIKHQIARDALSYGRGAESLPTAPRFVFGLPSGASPRPMAPTTSHEVPVTRLVDARDFARDLVASSSNSARSGGGCRG